MDRRNRILATVDPPVKSPTFLAKESSGPITLPCNITSYQQKQCSSLKDAGACELMKMDHIKERGEVVIQLPSERPHYTCKPFHTSQSWKAYVEDISKSPFARFTIEGFSPAEDDEVSLRACRFLKGAVGSSCFILTILASLESGVHCPQPCFSHQAYNPHHRR